MSPKSASNLFHKLLDESDNHHDLTKLDDLGIADSTYVVFTSDNGYRE
jgi:arylsulfatase A-like enzyme